MPRENERAQRRRSGSDNRRRKACWCVARQLMFVSSFLLLSSMLPPLRRFVVVDAALATAGSATSSASANGGGSAVHPLPQQPSTPGGGRGGRGRSDAVDAASNRLDDDDDNLRMQDNLSALLLNNASSSAASSAFGDHRHHHRPHPQQQQQQPANVEIRALNVTMFIPELLIGRRGDIHLANVNLSAAAFELHRNADTDEQQPLQRVTGGVQTNEIDEEEREAESDDLVDFPELRDSINFSLNPCDNFFKYVCDGWLQKNHIKEDKASHSQFNQIGDLIDGRIHELLGDRKNFVSLPPFDNQMFTLYDACMNNETRNATGALAILRQLLAIREAKEIRFVTDWLIKVHPISLFYAVTVGPDLRNTTSNILTIQTGGLLLGSERYYIEPEFSPQMDALRRFLRRMIVLLADDAKRHGLPTIVDVSSDAQKAMADAFVEVETKIALIMNVTDKHYDNVYADDKYMTVTELMTNISSSINWVHYLESVLPAELRRRRYPNGLASAEIRVGGVGLIRKLERMTRGLSNATLKAYMDWRLILDQIYGLDDRYLDAKWELEQVLQGVPKRPSKIKECKGVAVSVFGPLLERVYIRRWFDADQVRPRMQAIFAQIRSTFHGMLMSSDWMDRATRRDAIHKLARLHLVVGNADRLFNDTRLRRFYQALDLREGVPFTELLRRVSDWVTRENYWQLLEPVEVDFNGLDINGFYYPVLNTMVLTAGLLEDPFFNASMPVAVNYGSIGAVLAHEMTHGYDNSGRLHDETGNVRDWWGNGTEENFNKKKQCFIDQYSAVGYPPDLAINGEMTQGENIADNGGLRASLMSLQRVVREQPSIGAKRIRGLEQFTPEQLFYSSYAFIWCTKQRPEALISTLLNDNHAPPEARVNVVLGNSPDFSRQFQCPVGSPMNPKKKCAVW